MSHTSSLHEYACEAPQMTDLAKYLVRREMVSSGLLKFDDHLENWRVSFRNVTRDLNVTAREELDLLTKSHASLLIFFYHVWFLTSVCSVACKSSITSGPEEAEDSRVQALCNICQTSGSREQTPPQCCHLTRRRRAWPHYSECWVYSWQ